MCIRDRLDERTGIRSRLQRIRYGFPLKVLNAGPTSTLLDVGILDGEVQHCAMEAVISTTTVQLA
eukprot:2552491-Amphidinium_carterae.1